MKLLSYWTGEQVYWRTFDKGDTAYWFGRWDGFLTFGENTFDDSSGSFQLELKRGGLGGSHLLRPRLFYNSDEYVLTQDGQLVEIADAAEVIVDRGMKFEPMGSVVAFYAAGPADSQIRISSAITQTTSTGNAGQTTTSVSATDENQRTVGGEVTGSFDAPFKVGLKFFGSLSNKVTNKAERVVSSTLNVQISTATSYSEDQTILLKANRLTVIRSGWQRRYVTGSVRLGSTTISYEATLGYVSSREVSDVSSVEGLPDELLAEYRRQNPGSGADITVFDPAEEFSAGSNPAGVWSYGYSATLGSQFILHNDNAKRADERLDWWRTDIDGSAYPAVARNSANVSVVARTLELEARALALHPGPNNELCVLRFVAPADGEYIAKGYFSGRDRFGATTSVYARTAGRTLFESQVGGFGLGSNRNFEIAASMRAGEFLDFVVGAGINNNYGFDSTLASLRIFLRR